MVVLRLADEEDRIGLEVIGNELWLKIHGVKLVLRFTEKKPIAEMILALKAIARHIDGRDERRLEQIFYPTIATIDLENLLNSPECYTEDGKYLGSCTWAHDLREFIKHTEEI